MPRFTIAIVADHTGTAHQIEIDAATPWLALEKTHQRYKWLTAEVFERGRSLGKVDHVPLRHKGVWFLQPRSIADT